MLISKAYAQSVEISGDVAAAAPEAPSATEAFIWNMGLVAILVAMFYLLLIRPQQKRMKEHAQMLSGLKKGDEVITAGGLVGKISKISDASDEVEVDLGNGMKVSVMRNMLQAKNAQPMMKSAPANDAAKAPEKAKK